MSFQKSKGLLVHIKIELKIICKKFYKNKNKKLICLWLENKTKKEKNKCFLEKVKEKEKIICKKKLTPHNVLCATIKF